LIAANNESATSHYQNNELERLKEELRSMQNEIKHKTVISKENETML
jgi:hypothetical protein